MMGRGGEGQSSWWGYLHARALLKHSATKKDLHTDLRRCLSTWQLTLLGLGSTIGVGIYVMLGVMARDEAGPSVVFSFLIAILVTLMNAMVYAEFSTHVPQTGASYIYLYKVFGEFAAFLVGSITIASGLLSSSVGARAWSGMLDSLFNHTLQDYTTNLCGNIQFGPPFAENLDIVAFMFQFTITIIVSCNIFCTSIINTILGVLTTSVLVFVFVVGIMFGDSSNFYNVAHGGFFPFGVVGVIKAASLALYATSGFDVISMSAEEAEKPSKSIPRAMIAELCIVGLVYIGAAVGMLFLTPYWLIDLRAPLPSAFQNAGLPWGQLVVTIGPLFGVTNLQMLGLYGLSRCIYRMAKDGLFFSFFLVVDKRTGVPTRAVLFAGFITVLFALVCDLSYIVKMTVILMLTNYMSVAPALIRLKISEGLDSLNSSTKIDMDAGRELKADEEVTQRRSVLSVYDQELRVYSDEGVESGAAVYRDEECEDIQMKIVLSSSQTSDNLNLSNSNNILQDKASCLNNSNGAVADRDSSSSNNFELGNNLDQHHPVDSDTNDEITESLTLSKHGHNYNENQFISPVEEHPTDIQVEAAAVVEVSKSSSSKTLTPNSSGTVRRCLAPLVPGVMSPSVVLLLHLTSCITLAGQLIYGQDDIIAMKPVAVVTCVLMVTFVLLFSTVIWALCATEVPVAGFKTPMMPAVPTLSIVFSCMMVFSAAERDGLMEIVVMVVIATAAYIMMTLLRFYSGEMADIRDRRRQLREEEQSLALMAPEEEDE